MKRRIISSSPTRNNSTQNASKFNPSLIGSNRSEIQVPSDFYSPRNFPFILKCKRYRRNPEGAVERESQQISRRKNGTCVRHWNGSRFKTSRPREVPSGRMKNRRNLRSPPRPRAEEYTRNRPHLLRRSWIGAPPRTKIVLPRINSRYYSHTDAGRSCLCARKGRASMCVLDTYRQSEIYVARGESGALKYYRFASRARVCIFMRGPADEDGNTERETKWRKGEREREA